MKLFSAILLITFLNRVSSIFGISNGCGHLHLRPASVNNELYQPGPNYVDCLKHTHNILPKPEKMAWGGHANSNYGFVQRNVQDNVYSANLFANDRVPKDYQINNFGFEREGYEMKAQNNSNSGNVGLDGLNRNRLQDRFYTDNRLRRRFNKPSEYYYTDLYYDPDVYTGYVNHSNQP